MNISVNLKVEKAFTKKHLETYLTLNPKERTPWLYGEDLPKTFELVNENEQAALYDFDEVNWTPKGKDTQGARVGGKNQKYKEIALSIDTNGFKLDKPCLALLRHPNGEKEPLNGLTRKEIITRNFKKIPNFIGVLFKIKDEYVNKNGSYKPEASSDLSIFSVTANTYTDPAGLTTKDTVFNEVCHAIDKKWIKNDFLSIQNRVDQLCGKGIFAERTRQDLAHRIHNQYSSTDMILPWDAHRVKDWRVQNNLLDITWDEPKKIGKNYYDGIKYVIVSSETLEKSTGTVARIAKENPTYLIRVVIHTGVLRGYDVQDNFLNKINGFKTAWQVHLDNLAYAFFNNEKALVGIDNRVCLYGCLPAIQKCHDLNSVIKFVSIVEDEDDEDYNPHGLQQNGKVVMLPINLITEAA